MTRTAYTPATDTIDPTAPGGIERILAFHRAVFGDARMDATQTEPATEGDEREPDPAATAGYPTGTPIAQMTDAQQAAYWKHHSRKNEQRLKDLGDIDDLKARAARADELEAERLTDQEKALADAKAEASAAARAESLPKIFAAEFRAAAAGRIPADRVAVLVAPLNPQHFLTPQGEVDTDKVQKYVDGIAPAGKTWPDMGQGNRGGATKADPREAGRAAAERRFGKTT